MDIKRTASTGAFHPGHRPDDRLCPQHRSQCAAPTRSCAAVLIKPVRPSCLDPYKPYLLEREHKCRLSAVRLLQEIQPQGYTGSVDVLRRFLKSIRDQASKAQ